MLIVFDLDDTLIDTSGSITPIRIRDTIHHFVQKGFLSSFEPSYTKFLEINRSSLHFQEALRSFLQLHGGGEDLMQEAQEIYNSPHLDMTVRSLPLANQILNQLQVKYSLALLSYGSEDMQLKKLEKGGIDKRIFSKIIISSERNKKPYYQKLLHYFGVNPQQVIACGDRVLYDLVPAKELGCRTIHIKWGRGKLHQEHEAFVDKQVENLEQCYEAIESGF